MKIGYLDCCAGVAGDMWVGALLDAGLPFAAVERTVAALPLPGVSVRQHRVLRAGLGAVQFEVCRAPGPRPHRHLADIVAILERAAIPARVRQRAVQVFTVLAEAEATVHRTSVDAVHFHEVGAEDTIVDVVCACAGIEELGLERLYASPVAVGSGVVHCEHGTLPVPAPATAALLTGVPVVAGSVAGEATTPTGAALLKVWVAEFAPALTWVPERSGYGAGERDPDALPNVLRLTVGHTAAAPAHAVETVLELQCTLDTASGEQLAYLIDGALARGAVDAHVQAVHMKKGRPGQLLSVLCPPAQRDALLEFLLEESTSLGVRWRSLQRAVLERWGEAVDTEWGVVRYKVWRAPGGDVLRRPEEDEVRRLLVETGLSRRALLSRLPGDKP